jgi:hypothetical protein
MTGETVVPPTNENDDDADKVLANHSNEIIESDTTFLPSMDEEKQNVLRVEVVSNSPELSEPPTNTSFWL